VGSEVVFRAMGESDVPAGLRLCRAAGWNQTEEDWRTLLEPPSVFRVAAKDGQVIGAAGAIVYGGQLAWVCMVLVDPEERGRGLGTELVERVLRALPPTRAVGLDATPGGRPVYARLGFRDVSRLLRLERAPAPPRVLAAEASPSRTARTMRESAVLEWDRAAFGADRSRVLRGAWAACPECAHVVDEEGTLDGYCFGRPGHRATQIGPLVAVEEASARALVDACLARGADRRLYLDAPERPEWRSLLQQRGFAEQRPFTRMYRRPGMPAGRTEEVFAIAGPEFG
jgi:GNAT superfamily N-acetyltransferase